MRVIVTGSITTDCLMMFPGRLIDQIITDGLDSVSLSFLVEELKIRSGGVAANIAFGLGQLGVKPVLVGAVGKNFAEYQSWLDSHGVGTGPVLVSGKDHTARFLCITNRGHNQIASFYICAIAEARTMELEPIVRRSGGADLVVIAPNDSEAMLRHTRECRTAGHAFAVDPSYQLAGMGAEQVRELIESATWLFTNEYERELLLSTTKWSVEDVLTHVGTWVTTLGERGVTIESSGAVPLAIRAVSVPDTVEPTGVGDAFRAGFIAGIGSGMNVERAAQLGCVTASFALKFSGPQSYTISLTALLSRLGRTYGRDAEIELATRVQAVEFDPRIPS